MAWTPDEPASPELCSAQLNSAVPFSSRLMNLA